MSNSNRRTFLRNVGQGTLAAGMGLGLAGSALPNAYGAEDIRNDNSTWPYPIQYGKETEVDVDVAVVGGGIAGCWAAISAAQKGLKVALLEKGSTLHSGSGGSGIDHWQNTATHPACRVGPDELAQSIVDAARGCICGITRCLKCHESYDRLLELEKMGMKIRDDEDEFKGADFRDEKTKMLFAYNYQDKYIVRIWGTALKPVLTRECRRLGVRIYDRVMGTSLLSANGRPGNRIAGVTGLNVRTGEFLIFRSKATILSSAGAARVWQSVDNLGTSSHRPPVVSGDGFAMAWNAGAMFTGMEQSGSGASGGLGMTSPGANASWFPMTLVDANGKEIPWFDKDGRRLTTVSERSYPAPGQKLYLAQGGMGPSLPEFRGPSCLGGRELQEQIKKGDFVLPLYADLPSMPERERKAIFGLMIGQEGLTWIGYRNLCRAGFDRDKDMLQLEPRGGNPPNVRSTPIHGGGLVVDWNLQTNLEGLYAAGETAFGTWGAAGGATSGHWAGRKAAEYALRSEKAPIDRQQAAKEKERVLAPAKRTSGMLWKELENGVAKVMQDYCGDVKNEEGLKRGSKYLTELNDSEAKKLWARTPHELMRSLEALNIIEVGQMIINASMARKASSNLLGFQRSDYPLVDPPEWHKFITIKLEQDQVKAGELPINYGAPLAENYAKYSK
jgi:succinate dehydrogenase/fumarate reductase flavoprotein subunit